VEGVVFDKQEDIVSRRKRNSFFCGFSFCPSTASPISKERGLRSGFGQFGDRREVVAIDVGSPVALGLRTVGV